MMTQLIEQAVRVLGNGGVVLHATDTCYGFACDAFNEAALKKLYELKGMSFDKPVSILVSSYAEAEKFALFNEQARVLAHKYWPGALTLVLPRKDALPSFLNPGITSVGIRVPNHALSLALVKKYGRPITTTSANVTTQPSPYSVEESLSQFDGRTLKPDFVIDSGSLSQANLPSTIIDLTGESPRVIRKGSLIIDLA